MKLIILGSNGMMGSMLSFVCRKMNYPALRVSRTMFDALHDPVEKLKKYFDGPCCVVNCIGAIPQKKFSDDDFLRLNSEFPQKLAAFLKSENVSYIHMSTNCVFSGNRGMCSEEDAPDASDVYGLSKFRGEPDYGMIIRCSIIGPERNSSSGLMEWFLQNKDSNVYGYDDHFWNGLTTHELANIIIHCVSNNFIPNGLFHFNSEAPLSKYELLCELKRLFGKSTNIIPKSQGVKHYTLASVKTHPQKSIVKQLEEVRAIYDEFKAPLKFLFFNPGHGKNTRGLELMCAASDIKLEQTHNKEIVFKGEYDVLISNDVYFDPESLPTHAKVIFGPQFFVFPSGPLCAPYESKYEHRVVYNSLSKWVENMLNEFGDFKVPIVQFPFAVDIQAFTIEKRPIYDCLIYSKARHINILNKVIETVINCGLTFKLITYGKYKEEDYKDLLGECRFMLVLGRHESQGFALQEAMASNTPLLVLDSQSMYDEVDTHDGITYIYKEIGKKLTATSVPYWSDECGIKIESIEDLPIYLNSMLNTYTHFNPRKFIESTLSAKPCLQNIVTYFNLV
jgi:dTDP-4-dehydrorhamnose reductase